MRERIPPMFYDGTLFWYTAWFDPAEDRCCVCRGPIPDAEVPLILFQDVQGQTWQSRMHFEPCAQTLFASGHLQLKDR